MPDATHDTLREQVGFALRDQRIETGNGLLTPAQTTEAMTALVAERERLLRERIEALHDLYDRSYHDESAHGALDRAAAVFDDPEPEIEHCPVCKGIVEHVLGCPEMDKAR